MNRSIEFYFRTVNGFGCPDYGAENGYVSVIQDWMQLPDGSIQFTVNWIEPDR